MQLKEPHFNIIEVCSTLLEEHKSILFDEEYKFARYALPSTIAIIQTSANLLDEMIEFFRLTDCVKPIPNGYLVIFRYTSERDAFKAMQNFMHRIGSNNGNSINVGISGFAPGANRKRVLTDALKALLDALDYRGNRIEISMIDADFSQKEGIKTLE